MKFHFSLGFLAWWQDVLQQKWGHVYNALSSENVLIYLKNQKVLHRAGSLSYKFFLLNTIAIILYYKHLNNNPFTAVLILSSFPPSSWSEAIVAGVAKAIGSSVDNEREPQTQGTAPGGFWEPESERGDLTNTGTTRHGTGHRHRRHTCKRAIYRAGPTPRRQIKLFFYTCSGLHLSVITSSFEMRYLVYIYLIIRELSKRFSLWLLDTWSFR